MNKLLLLIAFAFIGAQAFSQVCMLAVVSSNSVDCSNENSVALVKIDPLGTETILCDIGCGVSAEIGFGCLGKINEQINQIINEGYTLIDINGQNIMNHEADGDGYYYLNPGVVYVFATL